MKLSLRPSLAVSSTFFCLGVGGAAAPGQTDLNRSRSQSVGSWKKGTTPISRSTTRSRRKFLRTYLELLDFSHLFFTQKDVDALNAKYGTSLDDDVLLGNLKPAYEIYDLYQKRVDDRVAKIKELLKEPIDFKTDDTIEFSRQKSPWPKDEAEADEIWRGRIANELLQEKLSEHPIEPGPKLVARRYDRLMRNVHEEDKPTSR